jgi:cytosine/adenosine deaminase-related metal-dependent hydrolase
MEKKISTKGEQALDWLRSEIEKDKVQLEKEKLQFINSIKTLNKEELVKGSLEAGKYADFVILNQDLLTIESPKIKKTKVKKTYIGGQRVY